MIPSLRVTGRLSSASGVPSVTCPAYHRGSKSIYIQANFQLVQQIRFKSQYLLLIGLDEDETSGDGSRREATADLPVAFLTEGLNLVLLLIIRSSL